MSKAQEAFRAVIKAGYYPGGRGLPGCPYMCIALSEAEDDGAIDTGAWKAGRDAIRRALGDRSNCMAEAMLGRCTSSSEDRQWAIEHGVELYVNWDERVETLEFPEWFED